MKEKDLVDYDTTIKKYIFPRNRPSSQAQSILEIFSLRLNAGQWKKYVMERIYVLPSHLIDFVRLQDVRSRRSMTILDEWFLPS
jgi:hypothetical protein